MDEDASSMCGEFVCTGGRGKVAIRRARGFFCIIVAWDSVLQPSRTLVIKSMLFGDKINREALGRVSTTHVSKIHSRSKLSLVGLRTGQRRRG